MISNIFSCVHWTLYVFFGETSIQIFCQFFDWVVSFLILRYSYILEIKPLLVAAFANIFFQSVGCPYVLFMVPLAVQKLISLIRHQFSLFVLPWKTQENISMIYVRECFACVSSRSFMVSCFILKPFSHSCLLACRFLVPWPVIRPGPQQWKHWVPTTGLPWNSTTLLR